MKKILSFGAIILCILLLLPLTAINSTEKSVEVISPTITTSKNVEKFRIYNTETKETEEISTKDYLFGVVAAEMPVLYNEEALKAQAVAAYTFALFRKSQNTEKTYDLTDNHQTDQSYVTKQEAEARWGDNAAEYTEKINKILSEVENYAITYNSAPILAVYHAISYGKTEDAENIWGKSYPYLKSVESYGDKLCDGYVSTLTVSENEFKEALESYIDFSNKENITASEPECTDAGTVKTIKICDTDFTGSKIRELFSLRSSNFKLEQKDGSYNFTVYGYGHAVGLSQNGADFMAKQGSNFKEILTHYYPGCKIEKIKNPV